MRTLPDWTVSLSILSTIFPISTGHFWVVASHIPFGGRLGGMDCGRYGGGRELSEGPDRTDRTRGRVENRVRLRGIVRADELFTCDFGENVLKDQGMLNCWNRSQ